MSHILSQFINYQSNRVVVMVNKSICLSRSPSACCMSVCPVCHPVSHQLPYIKEPIIYSALQRWLTITWLFTKYICIEWLELLDLIPLNIPSKESKMPLWGVTSFLRNEQRVKCFILAFNPETRWIMVIFICKSKFCSALKYFFIDSKTVHSVAMFHLCFW